MFYGTIVLFMLTCNSLVRCVSIFFQGECRLLNVESPELNPLLSQAMESLQDRPVLFKYSLDEYANARRAAVVRSFIDALTRGGRSCVCTSYSVFEIFIHYQIFFWSSVCHIFTFFEHLSMGQLMCIYYSLNPRRGFKSTKVYRQHIRKVITWNTNQKKKNTSI